MAVANKVEVVISGISGVFPECDNVEELKAMLFNKQSGITLDSRRWPLDEYGVTSGVGKVKSINRFDNIFFNMHYKLCRCSETMIMLNLEKSVEAIIDAGLNPSDLYNTNTAVFACSSGSETDSIALFDESKTGFAIVGHNRAMQANRLSYVLNLNGPSFTMISMFSGGLDALVMAKHMIEKGYIRAAIIGSCNLVQRPNISLQLKGLGILTDGVETRSFSDDADGFNRSEACVAVLLQNSLDAKRSYGTLMSVKMEQYGEIGGMLTSYSPEWSKKLILEAYEEAGVDPASVAYVEADGSGIKNADAMELDVIKEVFCAAHRKEPLKVGSVKSNLGHTDASSGFISIVKAIIAMESGYIPPNMHYNAPNSKTDALTSGKLQVVTEKTPLDSDVVGVNVFGVTGNYGHIVLKRHNKPKKRIYAKDEMFDDGLPRLILVSGRNDAGVKQTIKLIESYNVDEEYASLLHQVYSKNISAHFSRSFFITPTPGPYREKDVYSITNEKPPVWYVFSGMGSQWHGMGTQLLNIPIFARAIAKCDAVLRPKGLDITDIITSLDLHMFDNILHSFVGISAIQIGLVDILNALEIKADGMIGHSVGELGCAYADGCFTAEEMIMAAYARGRASVDTKLPDGMMAAIGLGYKSIKDRLPHDIDVACHNSSESCTISGPAESVMEFVNELKSQNVFAKAVNVSNISFHSRYIQPAAPTLLKYLNEILPNPKERSPRWYSTSIPESKWDSDMARYCSAEYHTNNLLSPVLFEEACVHIPKNAIVIEIAPHGLLQAILKKSLSTMVNISLTQRVYGDSVRYLLTAIGKMYCNGLNPNINMLYNPIDFPVSSGTPPLHTLSLWNHDEEWSIIDIAVIIKKTRGERFISLSPTENSSIEEYEIHGRHVLPLSALLFYTWESFVQLRDKNEINLPVIFQDVQYHQHVMINKIESSDLCTSIQAGTGRFELCLYNKIILSGNIFVLDDLRLNDNAAVAHKENVNGSPIVSLGPDEVYSSLEKFGYCVGDVFKTIKHVDIFEDELQSDVLWDNNWIHYLDAMLQLPTVYHTEKCGEIVVPVMIQELCVDPTAAELTDSTSKNLMARYNIFTNEVTCAGVKISLPRFEVLPLDPFSKTTFQLSQQCLVNLINPNFNKPIDFVDTCMDVILEYRHCNDYENVLMCPVYDAQDHVINNYTEHILNTKSSDVELIKVNMSLKHLVTGSDSSQYVVLTKGEKLSHAIALVANKSRAHLIVSSNGPMSDNNDYTVVLQQKFGETYLSLLKKTFKIDNDVIIHKLTKENINCPDQLQKLLQNLKSLNKTIYIVSKIQPAVGILPIVKKTNEIKNIRFFFVLDSSAPTFSTNNPFYSKQIAKHLLVNVYRNGEWVTYKEIEFINNINVQTSVKKKILVDLSNISINNVSVKHIGLNPQDTCIKTKNNNYVVEYELGPVEYAGLKSDGSMTAVMGVAPFSPTITDITPDPILSWTIPKNMSFEEASTIPVPYSMAYYILVGISKITENHSVLVHAGLTAVGRAAIDVCLEKNCQVFVTVSDFEQIELLKQRFPSLPHSNIMVYTKEDYEINFLMANKKMDVIINCLDGEYFYACLRLIALSGKVFQLAKTDMKKKLKMGMLTFLQNVSLFSIGMNRLLMENEEIKKSIQNSVERGLENGTVKPFDRYVMTGACTGTRALETLEKLIGENNFQRVVLSTSKVNDIENITNQFQCRPDKVYFVIGNRSDDWLCLVKWLAQRGAIKFVVALEKHSLTPIISRKFNILMDHYKGIAVQLVSQSSLNTEELACSLVDSSVTTCPLAAMFFVSTVDEKIIENMQYAMNQVTAKYQDKPLFVSLFCGGAKPCETLKSTGFNAFCLSWAQNNKKPKLSEIIPILDSLLLKSKNLTSAVVICSELVIKQLSNSELLQSDYYNMFLPSTVDELEHNAKYIVSKPDFVEVATKSMMYADAKGAYPIFVMPGFRPNNMKKLYRNLGYPTFEARYPENIASIKSVAEVLVNKLRQITEHCAVTLIGESWGGSVALIMAQILESEGILVSLSLLNGVPGTLIEWTIKNLIVNNNMNAALLSRYLSIDDEIANKFSSQQEWNTNLIELLRSNNISSAGKVCSSLNAIQTQLNTLIALKPLPNKLLSVLQVFMSSELSEKTTNILNEFCINPPVIHIVAEAQSQDNMLENAKVINTVNEEVAIAYPHHSTKSLDDKYKQQYYYIEVPLLC